MNTQQSFWHILIVDNGASIATKSPSHQVTKSVLSGFKFESGPLRFHQT
ncbi:hypothetical protein [Pseudoalteromonas sp. A601]|nr:hypothetical protein [Pseudoalteromonas sp. A601]